MLGNFTVNFPPPPDPISLPFSSRRTWSPVEYTRTFKVLPSLPGQVQLRNSSDQPQAPMVSVRPSGTGRSSAISNLPSAQMTRRWNHWGHGHLELAEPPDDTAVEPLGFRLADQVDVAVVA